MQRQLLHKQVNMLVAAKLLLLFTLIPLPFFQCSSDTDLQQLPIEQLLLYNTIHGEGTWIYANESEYISRLVNQTPSFLQGFGDLRVPSLSWTVQPNHIAAFYCVTEYCHLIGVTYE